MQTITLHPDTRMHLLIDLMEKNSIDCSLGELHQIIDETEAMVSTVKVDLDGIKEKLNWIRKAKCT